MGQWVMGLCHCKERGHFPIGMEDPGVFLSRGEIGAHLYSEKQPLPLRCLVSSLGLCPLPEGGVVHRPRLAVQVASPHPLPL